MFESEVSRRTFARVLATGAAVAVLPLPRIAAASGKPRQIRLSANENPYGPSPSALEAMSRALREASRYPDELHASFTDDVASLHGVSTSEVLLGDGSSDVLRCAVAAFTGPKRPLVMADPSFESPASAASAAAAPVIKVPLLTTFAHDVAGMKNASAETGLIYVCNPNNPTATITPKEAIRQLLDSAPPQMTILVDEAYHHYATSPAYESALPLIHLHPNLIVARTFSKIYAMAGVRCGYAVAQKETIARLRAEQQWDAMNVVALAGAKASLADANQVATARKRNADTKAWLESQLLKLGYPTLPSEANFVMIDMSREVKPMLAALRSDGIHVGRLFPAMPRHMRVTIGTPDEMEAFVAAFKKTV